MNNIEEKLQKIFNRHQPIIIITPTGTIEYIRINPYAPSLWLKFSLNAHVITFFAYLAKKYDCHIFSIQSDDIFGLSDEKIEELNLIYPKFIVPQVTPVNKRAFAVPQYSQCLYEKNTGIKSVVNYEKKNNKIGGRHDYLTIVKFRIPFLNIVAHHPFFDVKGILSPNNLNLFERGILDAYAIGEFTTWDILFNKYQHIISLAGTNHIPIIFTENVNYISAHQEHRHVILKSFFEKYMNEGEHYLSIICPESKEGWTDDKIETMNKKLEILKSEKSGKEMSKNKYKYVAEIFTPKNIRKLIDQDIQRIIDTL
jgi:hypothetical protein